MIVLETLGGQTLAHMIEAERRELAPAELAHLGLQLGSAIRYLHRSGYLHLDLKPSNIVADGGRAKVIDLSLARPPGPAPAGIGTWCYLAPEQARGGELGPAADVWGIGTCCSRPRPGRPRSMIPTSSDDDEPSATASDSWEPARGFPELGIGRPWTTRTTRSCDGRRVPVRLAARAAGLARSSDRCLPQPRSDDRPPLQEVLAGLEAPAELPPQERRWTSAITLTDGRAALLREVS